MDVFEHLAIQAFDLVEALESRPEMGFWVVDLESGEVILAGAEDYVGGEEREADYEDEDRFTLIEPMSSHEGFQMMEAFVESLPDSEGRRSLDRSLGHSRQGERMMG